MALATTAPSLTTSWTEIVTEGETYIIQASSGFVEIHMTSGSAPTGDQPHIRLSAKSPAINGVMPTGGSAYARSEGGAMTLVKY